MELNIYNKEGQLKATVSPADSSTLAEGLMADYILSLSFVLFDRVQFDVNDYVDFLGKRYRMLEAYIPNQKSTIEWSYNTKFYGIESVIRRALCLKTVDNELNPVFSLTAPAIEQVRLVVENINRVMGTTDWKVGEVIATDNLTIDYNGTYCNDALASIASAAETEWWIDGLTVNLCRCEYGELIELGYGSGLKEITLDTNENAKFFTRLFPMGSNRNIDPKKYGSSRLHLPGGVKYLEQNTHYGVIEHYEEAAFAAIYPRRVGKVGVVRKETKTGENKKPFDIYYFTDPGLNFNPNEYAIAGLIKQIVFETGDLAGRDFEVNYHADKKEFEVVTQWPYDDEMQLPGELVMKTGDDYILYNITMPTEYYALAETEFETAVAEYMNKNKLDKSVYKAPTDYIDLSKRNVSLSVGQRIHLVSDKYFPSIGYRDSRITKITRKVNEPLSADIEISDLANPGGKAIMEQGIKDAKHYAQAALSGLPDMIKSWENTPESDSNLYTAKKTLAEILKRALSRTGPDQTDFLLKLFGGIAFKNLKGIDGEGRAKLQSIEADSLKIRELIMNRLSAMEGDTVFTEAGTIDAIEDLGANTYRLTLRKRWDTDWTAFEEHDVDYGKVNTLAAAGEYYSSWFRVLSKNITANTITVLLYPDSEVPDGKNHPPVVGMVINRWGNAVNADRQSCWYISSGEGAQVYITGVTKPILSDSNYGMTIGKPKHLSEFEGLPINYDQPYLFARGAIIQDLIRIRYNGKPVLEEVYRGDWNVGTTTGADPYRCTQTEVHTVHHIGCKWRCVIDRTTDEPKWNAPGWAMIEGNSNLSMQFGSTHGNMFFSGRVDTTVTPYVFLGDNDISEDILAADWSWKRDTGNVTEDNAWAVAHATNGRVLHLSNDDMGSNWSTARKVAFICTAYVRDGESVKGIENRLIA